MGGKKSKPKKNVLLKIIFRNRFTNFWHQWKIKHFGRSAFNSMAGFKENAHQDYFSHVNMMFCIPITLHFLHYTQILMTLHWVYDSNIRTLYTMLCYFTSVCIGTWNIFLSTGVEFILPKHEIPMTSGWELYYVPLYQLVHQSLLLIFKKYINFPSKCLNILNWLPFTSSELTSSTM